MAETAIDAARLRLALERGYTLPWDWYSDPAVFRLEQERIFARTWQYAGRCDQVAAPGDYFTGRAGQIPLVVTRDETGRLNAFLNVCRHRGSVIAEGAGRRRTLQCPYHAWTYGLDGSLRAAPRSDLEAGFDADEFSLVRLRVETWGPFVFINADAEAAPLAETLGELPQLIGDAGIELDSLEFRVRAEYELATNWKVACENFLECYHCAVAHPSFSKLIDVAPDSYRLASSGLVSSQFGALKVNGGAPYDARGEVARGQFHFVWPNLKINIVPGRANVSIGPVLPLATGRTAGFLDYFFAPDADDEWVRDLLAFDDEVGREDRALVERVQQGMDAGVLERGRLLTGSEHLIQHFQKLLLDALS